MPPTEIVITETRLRAFLLGALPPAESEPIEERLTVDPNFFEELEAIEAELFDDFVRDALSPSDRTRFLRLYGEAKAQQLAAAHLLARSSYPPANVHPFARRRSFLVWAAAATVVIAVGGTMMMRRTTAPAIPPVLHQEASNPVAIPPKNTVPPSAARSAVLSLALTATRDGEKIPSVALQSADEMLTINVRLNPADQFSAYAVSIRGTGDIRWSAKDVRASSNEGELILPVNVPVSAVAPGDYRISVSGERSETMLELLGEARFTLTRP